jgi:hypothetical protein
MFEPLFELNPNFIIPPSFLRPQEPFPETSYDPETYHYDPANDWEPEDWWPGYWPAVGVPGALLRGRHLTVGQVVQLGRHCLRVLQAAPAVFEYLTPSTAAGPGGGPPTA